MGMFTTIAPKSIWGNAGVRFLSPIIFRTFRPVKLPIILENQLNSEYDYSTGFMVGTPQHISIYFTAIYHTLLFRPKSAFFISNTSAIV